MAERWNVELTNAAVDALWSLPRTDRAEIARRIDLLAEHGIPPSLRLDADDAGPVALSVGSQVMVCLEDPGERRIYIASLRPQEGPARTTIGGLFRHTLPRWLTEWTGGDGMGSIIQDIRFAVRSLRRSVGFTATAVLTLALGIGATAAIFSVANGVLLSPLPYGESEEVVTIWSSWNNFPDKTWVSVGEFRYYYQNNTALEDIALYNRFSVNFTSVDNPERVGASQITPNTLAVLGVEPLHGRVFTWEEAQDSVPPVLLGYGPFQRRFGGDPDIVGANVEINGQMVPVLGVLPEDFALPVDYGLSSPAEVYYPRYVDLADPTPVPTGGGSHGDYVAARMRPGETPASALADLERILDPLRADGTYAPERNFHPRLYAVKADIVGTANSTILVLLGAVGLVLLIACGNVANLLLSRSETRMREVAVRTALGAGRGRILRQLMTESLVLAGSAGFLGFVFAYLGVDALLAIDPNAVPRADAVSLDGTVVLFTMAVSLLTALVFGAVPAARVARSGLGKSLHEGGRGGGRTGKAHRLQGFLVALQMAMAVILLTGSGLMMKTFVGLLRIDPGFRAEDVLTMRVTAAQGRYPDGDAVARFYDEMLRRIGEVPGVRVAAAARQLPLASTMGDAGFNPVGYQPAPNESTQADWQWVTPGYFEAMGIPLLEGRTFDDRDRREGQPVVVINQTVARRYWGNESSVGREVRASGGDTAVVVGVVGDLRHNGITNEVKARYYKVLSQVGVAGYEGWSGSMRSMTLTVQTEGDPWTYLEAIRGEIREIDPTMPVAEVQTVDDVLSASVAQPRFAMVLLGAFAVIALSLAVVGIYGVLAYAVSKRTREIGIRLALGAERGQVTGMVVRQGMAMASAGVLVGTGIAWFTTRFMSSMLYEVTPQDPWTFVSVPLVFVGVAALASWLPAVRASRVRPAGALRYE